MRSLMTAAASAVVMLAAGSVAADPYIFGFTGNGAPTELVLGLSGGGSVTFNTGQFTFGGNGNNQGWWSATRANDTFVENFVVGFLPEKANNFFTFHLDGLRPGSVESATLRINDVGTGAGYPVTYMLHDVITAAVDLNFNTGTSAAITTDLETGDLYASVGLFGDPAGPFDIALNAAAIADINAAIGDYFSIGGTLREGAAIPEPASAVLLGAGLLGFGLLRRQRAR